MGPLIAHGAAVAVLIVLSYFAGRARGIEDAGRRWIAVLNRTELAYGLAYRTLHETHGSLNKALVGALTRAKEMNEALRAELEANAGVPRERN